MNASRMQGARELGRVESGPRRFIVNTTDDGPLLIPVLGEAAAELDAAVTAARRALDELEALLAPLEHSLHAGGMGADREEELGGLGYALARLRAETAAADSRGAAGARGARRSSGPAAALAGALRGGRDGRQGGRAEGREGLSATGPEGPPCGQLVAFERRSPVHRPGVLAGRYGAAPGGEFDCMEE